MKKTILLTIALFFIFGGWGYGQVATLPIHQTDFNNINSIDGWEAKSEKVYSGGAQFKLDSTNDWIQIHFDGSPGTLSFSYQGYNSWSENELLVEESDDGQSWTEVVSITSAGAKTMSGPHSLKSTSRFIKWTYAKSAQNVGIGDVEITEVPVDPFIFTNLTNIAGLNYELDSGPSAEQSFKASGTNLTDDIILSLPAGSDFEISETSGTGWANTLTLYETGGEVAETDIFVRLKEGLSSGNYNDQITLGSDDSDSVFVDLSGTVLPPFGLPYSNAFRTQNDYDEAVGYGFTFNGSVAQETGAGGYLKFSLNEGIETPIIDFNGVDYLSVKYDATTHGGTSDQKLTVYISDNNGSSYTEIASHILTTVGSTYSTFEEVIDLADYQSSNGKIKFEMSDGSNSVRLRDLDIKPVEKFTLSVTGTEGWRMLSSPTSDNTYKDLLAGIWTQGMTNSDSPDFGEPNVQYYDISSDSFKALSSLNTSLIPGSGFVAYVYKNEEWDESANSFKDTGTFPKPLVLYGTENAAPLDFSGRLNTSENEWTLAGNPFASPIEWDKLDKSGLTGVVYVYDHNYSDNIAEGDVEETKAGGAYRTWNGSAGSLTDGKIAAFQGFWVNNTEDLEEAHMLVFTESSKTAEGIYYKEAAPEKASFKLTAEIDGLRSSAYYSFNEHGKTGRDKYDALKLAPLDFTDYLSLSIPVEDTPMDINNLPAKLEEAIEFPLSVEYYKAAEDGYTTGSGEVTLSASDFQNIPRSWEITLNNYDTGETIDLRETELYTFVLPAAKNKEVVKQRALLTALSPLSEPVREKTAGADFLSITITPGGDTTVQTEPEEKPAVFALEQNYPNPFNPATTIKYSVARQGAVTLTIYNVMGQKITELVNGEKAPGHYSVSWNAARMASGVYFYRLTAGGQTLIRQMMLIK